MNTDNGSEAMTKPSDASKQSSSMANQAAAAERAAKAGKLRGEAVAATSAAEDHVADAATHIKLAARELYNAVGSFSAQSGAAAGAKMAEGKEQIEALEEQVESGIRQKPLLYLGVAFASGWLLSRLMK